MKVGLAYLTTNVNHITCKRAYIDMIESYHDDEIVPRIIKNE